MIQIDGTKERKKTGSRKEKKRKGKERKIILQQEHFEDPGWYWKILMVVCKRVVSGKLSTHVEAIDIEAWNARTLIRSNALKFPRLKVPQFPTPNFGNKWQGGFIVDDNIR